MLPDKGAECKSYHQGVNVTIEIPRYACENRALTETPPRLGGAYDITNVY